MKHIGLGLALLALSLGGGAPAWGQEGLGPISAGDLIYVEVYRIPAVTNSFQVDGNGMIQLPFVGPVDVNGLSEGEAAGRISEALRSIIRNPRVTVSKRDIQFQRAPVGRGTGMKSELVPLRNANASSLALVLRNMSSGGGSIAADPDTNTLIVTDSPDNLPNIINMIARLDQMQSQLTQVRIEAKIAEVRVGALKELGVRWWAQGTDLNAGFFPPTIQDPDVSTLLGGRSPVSNEQIGDNNNNSNNNGGIGRRFVDNALGGSFDRRLNVPVQVPLAGQAFFGLLTNGVDIGALLDMLVSDRKAQLLANPMTLTVNHKPSQIRMVDEFPFSEFGTEITGASSFSTRFIELGIKLDVTPHVYQDEVSQYVKMELEVEVSFPIGSSNGIPIRSVRSTISQPSVRNNQTLVIGGIMREDERNVVSKFPGLGNLPVVGYLFKRKEKSRVRTELMIFVTPTIYNHPEDITWDKMIDISEELIRADYIPMAELRGETRKD